MFILRNKFSLFLLIFLSLSGIHLPLISSIEFNNQSEEDNLSVDYLNKLPSNDYIIGPGDKLRITVSREYSDLTSIADVDGEGTIYLPKLNRVFVSGLTLYELNSLLNKAFKEYIKYPSVEAQVLEYRPIKVFVEGEVANPGIQTLSGSYVIKNNNEKLFNGFSDNDQVALSNEQSYFFPTVFDALRESGGITLFSDLSRIQVIRKSSLSEGGGKKTTTLNFEDVLLKGDTNKNIRIYDSDFIRVYRGEKENNLILRKAVLSKINPLFITIFVAGRVREPGEVKISKASTLNDAIDMAGGVKTLKGPVTFIRYENDGTIDKRRFQYRRRRKRGSYGNPLLVQGDFIYIGESPLTAFNEITTEITTPFRGLFSTYGLIKAISD